MPRVEIEIPSSTIDTETKKHIASLEKTIHRFQGRIAGLSNRSRTDEQLRKKVHEARDLLVETVQRLNEMFNAIDRGL